ncbi:MAG: hypothetical protein HDS66_03425 [Bacteroidales bacterium]|nr:hypothetical protein [Bacteroidales bacterium]
MAITDEHPVVTGFRSETIEDKKIAYNAISKQTGKVQDIVGHVVDIVNFHCSKQTYTDEQGVVTDFIKTILLLSDGTSYYAKSNILFRSLADFVSVFGMPDMWQGGARCRIVMSGKGYALEFIDFVQDEKTPF